MNATPTAAPFNLDQAQKTIGNSILHMVKASLGVQTNLEDPAVVAELWKSFQEALLAGSAACSLNGAIVAWPCQPWEAANRILTHDQP